MDTVASVHLLIGCLEKLLSDGLNRRELKGWGLPGNRHHSGHGHWANFPEIFVPQSPGEIENGGEVRSMGDEVGKRVCSWEDYLKEYCLDSWLCRRIPLGSCGVGACEFISLKIQFLICKMKKIIVLVLWSFGKKRMRSSWLENLDHFLADNRLSTS